MMGATVETTAREWPCTNAEYHASDERIGHSMLDVFRRSPKRYHARYVAKTIEHVETDAMRLGTLLHLAVLEPERFKSEVIVPPKFDRRFKEQKAEALAWEEANAGKKFASADELAKLVAMREAVFANATARSLLEADGPVEHSVAWDDHETSLGLKARRDKVSTSLECLVDIKTCRDASEEGFARAALTFGYHRQRHFYGESQQALAGVSWRFFFIAVCSEPPHECAVYELDDDAIALGRAQNRKALNDLAKAIEYDDWTAPRENGVTRLSLPRYAKFAGEYDVTE